MKDFFQEQLKQPLIKKIDSIFKKAISENIHIINGFSLQIPLHQNGDLYFRLGLSQTYILEQPDIAEIICEFFNENKLSDKFQAKPYINPAETGTNKNRNYIIITPKNKTKNDTEIVSLLYKICVEKDNKNIFQFEVEISQICVKKTILHENIEIYQFIKQEHVEVMFVSIENEFHCSFNLSGSVGLDFQLTTAHYSGPISVVAKRVINECNPKDSNVAYVLNLYNVFYNKSFVQPNVLKNRIIEAMLKGKDITSEDKDHYNIINDFDVSFFKNEYNINISKVISSYE